MNTSIFLKRLVCALTRFYFYHGLTIILGLLFVMPHQSTFANDNQTLPFKRFAHSQARLISSHQVMAPHEPIAVGLHLYLDRHWHSYWKNPGDSGAIPSLTFSSDNDKLSFGSIIWPNPVRIDTATLTSFAYEEEVLLSVPVTYTGDDLTSPINIHLQAEWLVCKEECVPAFGEFDIELKLAQNSQKNSNSHIGDVFLHATQNLPQTYKKQYTLNDTATQSIVNIPLPANLIDPNNQYDFFLFQADHLSNEKPIAHLDKNTLTLTFKKLYDKPTQTLLGTLHIQKNQDRQSDVFLNFSKENRQTPTPIQNKSAQNKQPLGLMICFAFLGGLLLNLMPCVFPIISLKLISLVNSTQSSKKAIRKDAALFILGCLSCFAGIASLIVVLKRVGLSLGWGFQLQSPVFILCLAFVFLLMALSFIDLIHLELPWLSQMNQKASSWKNAQSYITGFLAVLLATPCSAPFMGVSIGYALGQSMLYIFTVFLALGLGFAFPYVYIFCFPTKIPSLPKSGPWLKTFKHVLFFPMLATIVWLTWIYGQLQSLNHMFWLLITLLFFSSFIFLMKYKNTLSKSFFTLLILMNSSISAFALYKSLPQDFTSQKQNMQTTDEAWLNFSPKALQTQLDQQQSVFLDFTADWCLTCKVNESLTLNNPDVQQFIKNNSIVLMKADWTRYDPVITDFLKRYDRASIPFYLYYPKGQDPIILPELLTPKLFIDTLKKYHTKEN